MRTFSAGLATILGAAFALAGCAHHETKDEAIETLQSRTGGALGLERDPEADAEIPEGVNLEDGLSRDEAVAIALWNSPTLHAELARLDAADAEIAGARRPANPTLRLLFPTGAGSIAGLLTWPIESLVAMPSRIRVAKARASTTGRAVVDAGLMLTRDVRIAHANWVMAEGQWEIREQLVVARTQIAEIGAEQVRVGDLPESALDSTTADLVLAQDEAERAKVAAATAMLRLRMLMGLLSREVPLSVQEEPVDVLPAATVEQLSTMAVSESPSAEQAEADISSARANVRLEGWRVLNLAAVGQLDGSTLQLGPQFAVPIFDQNQAGRRRAQADLDAAIWRARAVRERLDLEVRTAHANFEQALRSRTRHREEVVQARERAVWALNKAFELGEADFNQVLLAQRDLEMARLRLMELDAEARRAHAELERALGGQLVASEGSVER